MKSYSDPPPDLAMIRENFSCLNENEYSRLLMHSHIFLLFYSSKIILSDETCATRIEKVSEQEKKRAWQLSQYVILSLFHQIELKDMHPTHDNDSPMKRIFVSIYHND